MFPFICLLINLLSLCNFCMWLHPSWYFKGTWNCCNWPCGAGYNQTRGGSWDFGNHTSNSIILEVCSLSYLHMYLFTQINVFFHPSTYLHTTTATTFCIYFSDIVTLSRNWIVICFFCTICKTGFTMMPLFLLQNKTKTVVTGVEMFKKTLDYGQVRILFLFSFVCVLLCCIC